MANEIFKKISNIVKKIPIHENPKEPPLHANIGKNNPSAQAGQMFHIYQEQCTSYKNSQPNPIHRIYAMRLGWCDSIRSSNGCSLVGSAKNARWTTTLGMLARGAFEGIFSVKSFGRKCAYSVARGLAFLGPWQKKVLHRFGGRLWKMILDLPE